MPRLIPRASLCVWIGSAWLHGILASSEPPASGRAEVDASAPQQKIVVGHQMLALPRASSDAALAEEIEQWKDAGLDAVMLFNLNDEKFRELAKRYYAISVSRGVPMHFALSHEGIDKRYASVHLEFMRELRQPAYAAARFLLDGRVFLTSYNAGPGLNTLVELAAAELEPVFYEPHIFPRSFFGPASLAPWESGKNAHSSPALWAVLMDHPAWRLPDGFAAFDFAPSLEDQARMIHWIWEAARQRGKTARGNIVATYKGYAHKGNPMVFEPWGYSRLLACWRAAIESGIPHVEFLTLNDMSESSYFNSWAKDDPPIMVEHWNTGDNAAILDHSGFRSFSKRYVQWFKSGVEPAITADELYYAYRLHPRTAAPYFELSAGQQAALQRWIPSGQPAERIYRKEPIPDSEHDKGGIEWRRFSDGIHVAVRLTAPAEIWINGAKIAELPAGEHLVTRPGAIAEGKGSLGYPMHTFGPEDFGFPRFEVRREGRTVMRHTGELEITPYPVPGCWNIFARQAPASAWAQNSAPEQE